MEKLIKEIKPYRDDSDITLVVLQGYLDSTTSNVLVQRFTKMLAERKTRFILDMSDIEFISSSGWNTVIGLSNNIRQASGDIKVTAMRSDVRKIFYLLEYTALLGYYKNVDDAALSFSDAKLQPDVIKNENLDIVEDFSGVRDMGLDDKIRKIKTTYPGARFGEIKKMLKTPAYDGVRVSNFKLALTMIRSFGKVR